MSKYDRLVIGEREVGYETNLFTTITWREFRQDKCLLRNLCRFGDNRRELAICGLRKFDYDPHTGQKISWKELLVEARELTSS